VPPAVAACCFGMPADIPADRVRDRLCTVVLLWCSGDGMMFCWLCACRCVGPEQRYRPQPQPPATAAAAAGPDKQQQQQKQVAKQRTKAQNYGPPRSGRAPPAAAAVAAKGKVKHAQQQVRTVSRAAEAPAGCGCDCSMWGALLQHMCAPVAWRWNQWSWACGGVPGLV
jgi:hypothetical protein